MSRQLLQHKLQYMSQTIVVVAVVRIVVVPVRNGAVVGVIVPRATAKNAVVAGRSTHSPITFFDRSFPY